MPMAHSFGFCFEVSRYFTFRFVDQAFLLPLRTAPYNAINHFVFLCTLAGAMLLIAAFLSYMLVITWMPLALFARDIVQSLCTDFRWQSVSGASDDVCARSLVADRLFIEIHVSKSGL